MPTLLLLVVINLQNASILFSCSACELQFCLPRTMRKYKNDFQSQKFCCCLCKVIGIIICVICSECRQTATQYIRFLRNNLRVSSLQNFSWGACRSTCCMLMQQYARLWPHHFRIARYYRVDIIIHL